MSQNDSHDALMIVRLYNGKEKFSMQPYCKPLLVVKPANMEV